MLGDQRCTDFVWVCYTQRRESIMFKANNKCSGNELVHQIYKNSQHTVESRVFKNECKCKAGEACGINDLKGRQR